MSAKTTIVLAILLVAAGAILWFTGSETPYNAPEPAGPKTLLAEKTLLPKELSEPDTIRCTLSDGQEVVFKKDQEEPTKWNITKPFDAPASSWQVQSIARKLNELKYQIRFKAGDKGAPTAEQAGLTASSAKVALASGEEKSAVVEIGKETGTNQNYVRLAGSDDIYVVNASLSSLLNKSPIQYRDQALAQFKPEEVKQLDVTEGDQHYTLAHAGGEWTFESPFKARASKTKLDGVARSLGTLRVMDWVEAEADDLTLYGLGPSAIVLSATIEQTVEAADDGEDAKEASENEVATAEDDQAEENGTEGNATGEAEEKKATIETRTVAVRLSHLSPIGEDSKVYVCQDGEKSVGTISKTIADQLKPDMDTWRDMRLTTAPITTADRVELSTPAGSATFQKQANNWTAPDSRAAIDTAAVSDLLKQISGLAALSFVDDPTAEASFGFDEPQAQIRLNIPGTADPEIITVGGFTDPQTKRMVYVRRGESGSAAKLRVDDVEKLLQSPEAYQDRSIFTLNPSQIEQIEITRNDGLTDARFSYTLARQGGQFKIAQPVEAPTQTTKTQQLAAQLATLRAKRVMPAAELEGLDWDQPAITCTLRYQPPDTVTHVQVPEEAEALEEPAAEEVQEAESKEEPAPEAGSSEQETPPADPQAADPEQQSPDTQPAQPKPAKTRRETVTPPAENYELALLRHNDMIIARRGDGATFEVEQRLWDALNAEYHEPDLLVFEASQVTSITVTSPDATQGFNKQNDQWAYTPEPDLPIDPKKVTDLLLRANDLKSTRWIAYNVDDLNRFGLAEPAWTVTVALEDGSTAGLAISDQKCENDPENRRYANLLDTAHVFLLSDEAIDRVRIDLQEFEAK